MVTSSCNLFFCSLEELNCKPFNFQTNVTHFIDTINRAGNGYAFNIPSDNLMMNFRILAKKKCTNIL